MVEKTSVDESCQRSGICILNATEATTAAIHQPNYIPWLGYFFKIAHADKFVFLDTVVFPGGSFINRNYIKTPNGPTWLTIPVLKTGRSGQLIGEVKPDNTHKWVSRHLGMIRNNYGKAQFFKEIFALLEPHYHCNNGDQRSLAEFNIGLICSIAAYLGLSAQFLRSSELGVSGHKTDLILDICRTIGATTYLAGTGAKLYQEDTKLKDAGIAPVYSPFSQQSYPQLFGEFVGNLAVIDVLMNCGYLGTRQLLGIESEHG